MTAPEPLTALTDDEVAALPSAGAWYASYHVRDIAAEAEVDAAWAIAERERFMALVGALAKLGVDVPLPDALVPLRQAA